MELPFSQSFTVFSSQTVAAFTGSLRKIRVAVRETGNHENTYKIIARFFELNYN